MNKEFFCSKLARARAFAHPRKKKETKRRRRGDEGGQGKAGEEKEGSMKVVWRGWGGREWWGVSTMREKKAHNAQCTGSVAAKFRKPNVYRERKREEERGRKRERRKAIEKKKDTNRKLSNGRSWMAEFTHKGNNFRTHTLGNYSDVKRRIS